MGKRFERNIRARVLPSLGGRIYEPARGVAAWDQPAADAMLPAVRCLPRRLLFVGLGLFAWSCLAPTIPMPPPSRPDIEGPRTDGTVVLTGAVEAGADVFAQNYRTGEIRGQRTARGDYRIIIGAQIGDWMTLFYRHDGDFSPSVEFIVPEPEPEP